ncbi:MAG: hypothetical protein AB8E82_01380 [Aureispira sp.]
MIILSKINFKSFNLYDTQVPNVDPKKMKGLTKAATRKLLNNLGVRAPFFLILNYFKDPSGKPMGHFLDIGTNKKMVKHFEQVEMKSGKLDKSMAASQKEAAMGEVYAQEKNGQNVLFFVPDDKSKIPDSKWPNILKKIRPLINNLKAFAVLNGAVVAAEEEGKGSTETELGVQETDDMEEGISLDALKALFQPISTMLKETLPQEILPRIKSKTVTEADDEAIDELQGQVEEFLEDYEQGTTEAKTALAKAKTTLEGQLPKIKQIATVIKANITTLDTVTETEVPPSPEEEALVKKLEELLTQAQEGLQGFDQKYQNLQVDLDRPPTPIPDGDTFLRVMP